MTLCKGEAGVCHQLPLYHVYYNLGFQEHLSVIVR
jgi:hypothetical protein